MNEKIDAYIDGYLSEELLNESFESSPYSKQWKEVEELVKNKNNKFSYEGLKDALEKFLKTIKISKDAFVKISKIIKTWLDSLVWRNFINKKQSVELKAIVDDFYDTLGK